MPTMKVPLLACAVLGAAALVALAMLAVKTSLDESVVELVSSGNNAKLLNKLNQILMHRLEARTQADQDGGPDSRYAAKAPLGMTKAQLEKAACDDGEPCKLNQMPILKYIPSTGDWDVVSAGNPDAIWSSLMNKAKARDESVKRSAEPQAEAVAPAKTEDLSQVDSISTQEAERQQLEAKLKSLLRAKLAKRRASFASSFARNDEDQGDADGPVQTIKQLGSDLHESRRLVETRHGLDTDRMQRVEDRLSQDYRLHSLCRHRHMVVQGLGVLKHSSLEGCVRQLKYRMGRAEDRLKSAVSELAFEPQEHGKSGGMELRSGEDGDSRDRYASLHAKKHRLSQELSALEKDHNELQEELKQQKERITQLTQSKKQHDSSFSPPAPPGLPPGYDGPLLAKGSTHVPLSRPPGM